MSRAKIIRTEIRATDLAEFRSFLKERGYNEEKVNVFASKAHSFVSLYFENPAEFMTYKLRGLEQRFMADRSHIYFYDLEDNFDIGDFFDDEDN